MGTWTNPSKDGQTNTTRCDVLSTNRHFGARPIARFLWFQPSYDVAQMKVFADGALIGQWRLLSFRHPCARDVRGSTVKA